MKNFFNKEFKIGNKKIGKTNPAFIIAEAGVNHNGQLKNAYKLIDIAKKSGADAIKFQTFNTKQSAVKNLKKAKYQLCGKKDTESQYEMLKNLELDFNHHLKIKRYCKKKKIIFFSTPSDLESLKLLKKLNVDCYKISSVDLNYFELIKNVCRTRKPVIISTGMSNIDNVIATKNKLTKYKNRNIAFLHCVSSYPTKEKHLNLNSIKLLSQKLGAVIGFSDHTIGYTGAVLAIACGAKIIEKHITINKKMFGPDHKISMEPNDFKLFIKKIREAEIILGKEEKKINKVEIDTLRSTKKVFVAVKDLISGQKLKKNMIILKSVGKGFDYKNINFFLGKKIKKTIRENNPIDKKYF